MLQGILSRLAGRLRLSASTYSRSPQDFDNSLDTPARHSSAAPSNSDRSRRAHGGSDATEEDGTPKKRTSSARLSSRSHNLQQSTRAASPPSLNKTSSAGNGSKQGEPEKKRSVGRRPRAPPPEPSHFQNVVMYYDAKGNVIMKETIDDVTGLPERKKKKLNRRVEDEMQANYFLIDPLTFDEVQTNDRIFVKKETMDYMDKTPGLKLAEACATPTLSASQLRLGKKVTTPTIVVDKKKLVGMVLFTERQKVMVKWQRQEVLLSQWDFFTMDSEEEFLISNLSEKTVARIQILEWVN